MGAKCTFLPPTLQCPSTTYLHDPGAPVMYAASDIDCGTRKVQMRGIKGTSCWCCEEGDSPPLHAWRTGPSPPDPA